MCGFLKQGGPSCFPANRIRSRQSKIPPNLYGEDMTPGFKFVKRIRKTAKSDVWEAEGPAGKRVALKLVPLGISQDTLEGLAFSRTVTHPNLMGPGAYWIDREVLIILMDLADSTVNDRLEYFRNEGRIIPTSEVVGYMHQIADALDYLETMNLTHLSIIPEHMFFVKERIRLGSLGHLRRTVPCNNSSVCAMGKATTNLREPTNSMSFVQCNQTALAVAYACLRQVNLSGALVTWLLSPIPSGPL